MAEGTPDLYRAAILEHARNPRNALRLPAPHLSARASNPLCGDEVELTLSLTEAQGERRIEAIGVQVRGCAIAQAAGSLMSEAIRHRTLTDADALGESFRHLMAGESDNLPPALETLRPLEKVRRHRSRIACALLAWDALRQAVREVKAPATGESPEA